MKTIILVLTMLLTTTMTISAQTMPPLETGVSQTLAKWRAANYSDVRYKLNITLEKNAPLMKGTIEVSVKLTDEGAKNDLILDWRTTQFANDKDAPFANVIAVNDKTANGLQNIHAPNYFISQEHLIVSKKFLKAGENVIKIEFASPIKTSGAAITRYVDKEDGAEYIYSLFVPSDASTAFPVFDQPDLKARFQLTVNSSGRPTNGWSAVSNTEPKSSFTSTWGIHYEFRETQPISTYVFAFAVGDFAIFSESNYSKELTKFNLERKSWRVNSETNNVEKISDSEWKATINRDVEQINEGSRIYVRQSQAEKFKQHSAEVFRLNREGVKFLETYFDYKFPFPKYDLVLIPEFPFGGMEHAGATFLRESSVIFPTEPTKNDYVSRANVIFHEAAHQWFGDTVTMKWFDDLWLKEGFAEFMAYKTLEKVMPEYNAWKIFYERNKQAAYLTDSTKGTTPIYQEIPNLSAAKSAYGNIVYRKAPSFLRQAEFYLGEKEFQTAVRAFLKKHEFANAEWTDLVKEFETASKKYLKDWANVWVKQKGLSKMTAASSVAFSSIGRDGTNYALMQSSDFKFEDYWQQKMKILVIAQNNERTILDFNFDGANVGGSTDGSRSKSFLHINPHKPVYSKTDPYKSPTGSKYFRPYPNLDSLVGKELPEFIFPNYQDYGYGIFLLDEKSRAYVSANIQTEKDDFLRAMMWGSLWDSVRETELNPKDYVELVIKNISVETDESTIQTLLNRVSTAMNYYLSDKQRAELAPRLELLLLERMAKATTAGQRITFYRALLNAASTDIGKNYLKEILSKNGKISVAVDASKSEVDVFRLVDISLPLKTKDRFDIVTKLLILGDKDAPRLLAALEKIETSDEAKRYAYAAKAGIGSAENKAKYWTDFTNNKDLSESYIESAFVVFNASKHADLTLPYLEKALAELPNLKKNRKIFFVNGWLSSFIGGQKSAEALQIVNKFLADNPNLDKDLRLKILENSDNLERAVKIRAKY